MQLSQNGPLMGYTFERKTLFFVNKILRSFELEVIFVKNYYFKLKLYFGHIERCLKNRISFVLLQDRDLQNVWNSGYPFTQC